MTSFHAEIIPDPDLDPTASLPKKGKYDMKNRPAYMPEYAKAAMNYAILGADDARMATMFGVCIDTLYEWRKRHPEFAEAILNGRDRFDAMIATSAAKALLPHVIRKKHVITDKNGEIVEVKETEEEVMTDPKAAMKWLAARQARYGTWNPATRIEGQLDFSSTLKNLLSEPDQDLLAEGNS